MRVLTSRSLAVVGCILIAASVWPWASAQTILDMSEINGDLKILGKQALSYTSKMAFLDFNNDGRGDLFVNDRIDDSVFGFLEVELIGLPNRFLDLLDEPYDFEIAGPSNLSSSQFGSSLATGDWNNDGIADLAIGDKAAFEQGVIEVGQVYVLFGSPTWGPGMLVDLEQHPADITIHHFIPGHSMGLGISLASGDVNGDGIADLAIGADRCGNPEDIGTGAVFVIFGSESFTEPVTINLSQTPADLSVYGEGAGDNFGCDVAMGDVNGDGIDDLVVGAWDADYYDQQCGRAYVIYGSDQFPPGHSILLNHQPADITIKGPRSQSSFGSYLDVGSFNGDEYADFCVTAYVDYPQNVLVGSAHLFHGRQDYGAGAVIDLEVEQADLSFYGDGQSALLGISAAFGETDGDGIDDLLLGAYNSQGNSEFGSGAFYLFPGRADYPANQVIWLDEVEPAVKVIGDDEEDARRVMSSPLLDIDEDGFDDICIGLGYADRDDDGLECGEIHVFLSRPPIDAVPRLVAGPGPLASNPSEVRVWDAFRHEAYLESFRPWLVNSHGTVVACGDLDGDGYGEIVAGPGPGAHHPPLVVITDEMGMLLDHFLAYGVRRFGSNVACGDLDGDGKDEILTGPGPGNVFGPHVRGWRWNGPGDLAPLPGLSYLAYGTQRYGVNVSCGDIDGDGREEIVTGAGPGAVFGPHVRGWEWTGSSTAAMSAVSFLAYGTNRFGVNVSCGDIDGDLIDEIVTGPGPGEMFGSHVRGWNYDGESLSAMHDVNFMAFAELSSGFGCVVACEDVDNDRVCEILTLPGANPDYPAMLKTWNHDGNGLELVERRSFLLFETGDYGAGGHVALGRLWEAPGYLDPPGR